jgi:hypothetical protein
MGIALFFLYVPLLIAASVIGNIAWVGLGMKAVGCPKRPIVPLGGFILGLAMSTGFTIAAIGAAGRIVSALPFMAPSGGDKTGEVFLSGLALIAASLALPLALGLAGIFLARRLSRGALGEAKAKFLVIASGGAINGTWGVPVFYLWQTMGLAEVLH